MLDRFRINKSVSYSGSLIINLINLIIYNFSPGCFSLFRAKAVMDENVMHKYLTIASEPRHYVQYDQGEDR